MSKLIKPEEKCSECKGKILWKSIVDDLGAPLYQGHCPKCAIVFKGREDPELARGRKLAENLINVSCMDKRVTQHSVNTQIGFLRAKQHCATCEGSYLYDSCKCKNCKCLHCQEN